MRIPNGISHICLKKRPGAFPACGRPVGSDDGTVFHLTEKIIACAIEVHRYLGAGLMEAIYRDCMLMEMSSVSLRVETERQVPLYYKGERLGRHLRLDMVVDDTVVVELKSVEALQPLHSSQVITYLKLSNRPVGLLINFNVTSLRAGVRRLVHPDLYKKSL